MRLLIDECIDWRLLRDLRAYDAKTLKQCGLEKLKNGSLLRAAVADFDVFVTVDTNLRYQQNIASLSIAVVVLRGRTTRLPDLRELLPLLHATLPEARAGEVYELSWRDLL